MQCFILPKTIQSSIGSEELRLWDQNISKTNFRAWLGMVNMIQICANQLIQIICPGSSQFTLRETLAQKLMNENTQIEQRRTKTADEQLNHLLQTIFKAMNASKKGSVAKRITRAILCAGVPRTNTLRQACEKFKSTYISTGTTRMEALADYQKLSEGEFVDHPKKYSRKRNGDDAIEKAVQFLLHPDKVRTFSWGTTVKHLSENETIVLPKLQRISSRTNLWSQYLEYILKTKDAQIGRTTFFHICNAITYTEEIILGLVDYVQTLLLTEPIELLVASKCD